MAERSPVLSCTSGDLTMIQLGKCPTLRHTAFTLPSKLNIKHHFKILFLYWLKIVIILLLVLVREEKENI